MSCRPALFLLAQASRGFCASLLLALHRHFYAIRPLRLTSEVAELAMDYTATAVGDAVGIAQGELQGSLRNLETISRIVTVSAATVSLGCDCCRDSDGRPLLRLSR